MEISLFPNDSLWRIAQNFFYKVEPKHGCIRQEWTHEHRNLSRYTLTPAQNRHINDDVCWSVQETSILLACGFLTIYRALLSLSLSCGWLFVLQQLDWVTGDVALWRAFLSRYWYHPAIFVDHQLFEIGKPTFSSIIRTDWKSVISWSYMTCILLFSEYASTWQTPAIDSSDDMICPSWSSLCSLGIETQRRVSQIPRVFVKLFLVILSSYYSPSRALTRSNYYPWYLWLLNYPSDLVWSIWIAPTLLDTLLLQKIVAFIFHRWQVTVVTMPPSWVIE